MKKSEIIPFILNRITTFDSFEPLQALFRMISTVDHPITVAFINAHSINYHGPI